MKVRQLDTVRQNPSYLRLRPDLATHGGKLSSQLRVQGGSVTAVRPFSPARSQLLLRTTLAQHAYVSTKLALTIFPKNIYLLFLLLRFAAARVRRNALKLTWPGWWDLGPPRMHKWQEASSFLFHPAASKTEDKRIAFVTKRGRHHLFGLICDIQMYSECRRKSWKCNHGTKIIKWNAVCRTSAD